MAVRLGPYTLLRKLAVGGMAELYLARREGPEGFQKLAVVKRILPQYAADPEFVGMFLDEARLAARLDHPNVVHIYDLGKTGNSFFIAMEYVAGEDLRSIQLQARQIDQPLPEGHMVRVFAEVAAALHHAHVKTDEQGKPLGIVHRDVSPQNVLVSYEGAVKLTDFGIAKAVRQAGVTKDGVLKGKHAYLSPEQVTGAEVDHRSDVFALGICLYEFATRTRLFKRDNELAMVRAIAEEPITPPRKIRPTIAGGLEEIIMTALEKSPARRFQTAQAMQVALERFGRDAEHQVGAVELADYMKELFADKIRAQKEAAAQANVDSFEALLLEQEAAGGTEASLPGVPGLESLVATGAGSSTSGLLYGESESARRARGVRRWWPLAVAIGVLAAAGGAALVMLGGLGKDGPEEVVAVRAKTDGLAARATGLEAADEDGRRELAPGAPGRTDGSARTAAASAGAPSSRPMDRMISREGGEREVGLLHVAADYEGPALVYLDGKLESGRLPVTIPEVTAGAAHVVRVEVEGYEPEEREERVEERRTTTVRIALRARAARTKVADKSELAPGGDAGGHAAKGPRLPDPRKGDVPAPLAPKKVDAPVGDAKDAKKKAVAIDAATRVPVFFDARPWAAVLLEGRKLCTTPCYYDLAPGTYTFTFRHDPAKLEKKRTAKIAAAGENRVIIDLK